MAQAADSPIGFRFAAKDCDPDTAPPGDSSLAELHAWQTSLAGLAASRVYCLGSTIADLKAQAASPLGFHLLVAELPNLELIQADIAQLISQLRVIRELAA